MSAIRDSGDRSGEGSGSGGGKQIVYVESELKHLVPGFLKSKREDLEQITAALERQDYETIRILGHRMKGEGGGFGFDLITEIGESLENAAKAGDAETIRKRAGELSKYLREIKVVYR